MPAKKRPRACLSGDEEAVIDNAPKREKKDLESHRLDSDLPGQDGGLSAYEKKRLMNIRRNEELLSSLDLLGAKQSLSDATKRKRTSSQTITPRKKPVEQRRSLRLQNITPDGEQRSPARPLAKSAADQDVQNARPPPGPLVMAAVEYADGPDYSHFYSWLKANSKSLKEGLASPRQHASSVRLNELVSLKLAEEQVIKVVPQRSLSLAWHPSASTALICTGDKWGRVGLCSLNQSDRTAYSFTPHSSPVSCLRFSATDSAKLYSCSYDGSLRCADLERAVFDDIYSLPETEEWMSCIDCLPSTGCLLTAENTGRVCLIDSRSDDRQPVKKWKCHHSSVKCVHVNPSNADQFVSSSRDGTVAIWDQRKITSSSSYLSSFAHGKIVASAFFSPNGQRVLSTSKDNSIGMCDVVAGKIAKKKTIRHDNQVGRWLTAFQAVWDPHCPDLFAIGSMSRPRQVQIYSAQTCQQELSLINSDWLGSVMSLLAFHPVQPWLAGVNSSGRVHIWQ